MITAVKIGGKGFIYLCFEHSDSVNQSFDPFLVALNFSHQLLVFVRGECVHLRMAGCILSIRRNVEGSIIVDDEFRYWIDLQSRFRTLKTEHVRKMNLTIILRQPAKKLLTLWLLDQAAEP